MNRELILRRHFDVIDDEGLDGAFLRYEFETELLLQGSEDGRASVNWDERRWAMSQR